MTATGQNFSMYAGDTCTIVVTVVDSAGDPKDISSSTIAWVVYHGNTIHLTRATGSGITLSNPTAGEFTISLVPANTEGLGAGTYSHVAEVTDNAGRVSTVTVGTLTILQSKA